MRLPPVLRPVTRPAERRDVAPVRVELVDVVRAVAVADVEVAVRYDRDVGWTILRNVGVLVRDGLGAHAAQLAPVWGAERHDRHPMVGKPEQLVAGVVARPQRMRVLETVFPRADHPAALVVGDDVVARVVREEERPPLTILRDGVAVLDWVLRAVQPTPRGIEPVAEGPLPEDLVSGGRRAVAPRTVGRSSSALARPVASTPAAAPPTRKVRRFMRAQLNDWSGGYPRSAPGSRRLRRGACWRQGTSLLAGAARSVGSTSGVRPQGDPGSSGRRERAERASVVIYARLAVVRPTFFTVSGDAMAVSLAAVLWTGASGSVVYYDDGITSGQASQGKSVSPYCTA